jgi:hypothetical protein
MNKEKPLIFLEIVMQNNDFTFDGRDELEEPLDEALRAAKLGQVTGGGSGTETSNIDVEVNDLKSGLAVIRSVLRGLGAAESTTINQYEPQKIRYPLFEG